MQREVVPFVAAILVTVAVVVFGFGGVVLAPDDYVPPGPRVLPPTFEIEELH
jgi:hypothetical protein